MQGHYVLEHLHSTLDRSALNGFLGSKMVVGGYILSNNYKFSGNFLVLTSQPSVLCVGTVINILLIFGHYNSLELFWGDFSQYLTAKMKLCV